MSNQAHTTNPTKQSKIPKHQIQIAVFTSKTGDGGLFFKVNKLDITTSDFPKDAKVILWAYTKHYEEYWDMGTVESLDIKEMRGLKIPCNVNKLQFRLNIYLENDFKLIGQASDIKPVNEDDPDQRQSLFDTQLKELGHEIWRIQLSEGEKPLLLLNNHDDLQAGDYLENNWLWRGLVLPPAMRATLMYLVKNPSRDDDPSTWQNMWKIYIKRLNGEDVPDQDDDDLDEWIDGVVREFTRSYKFLDNVVETVKEAK